MSVYPQGRMCEPELGLLSEYDRFSLDDAGTDCSCSTCSSCSSTCSLCDEEDGACGSSCDDDEYCEGGDSRSYTENHVINGRVIGRRAMRHRNGEAGLSHTLSKTEDSSEARSFPEERLLEFGSHHQGQNFRKANEIHENNSFSSSTSGAAITLRLEEMSLQGSWSNHSSSSMQDKKRKKVTFIDSSSSSDEMMLAEQFSMSSDNSASGYSPCLCSTNSDPGRRGNQSPASEASDKKRNVRTPTVDLNLEYNRLKNVLKTIDPSKLHGVLKHALKSKRSEAIVALATLLPKSKFTADTIHCVRCHKEFDPIYGKKQCALPHPERSVVKVSQDAEGSDFACSICGGSFRLRGALEYRIRLNAEQDCGVCFLGKHTPNTEEVDFGPGGAAQSCEDRGCIEFFC